MAEAKAALSAAELHRLLTKDGAPHLYFRQGNEAHLEKQKENVVNHSKRKLFMSAALGLCVMGSMLGARGALAAPTPQQAAKVSLADAEAAALRAVPGTIVDHELEEEKGSTVYSFEILPNGAREGEEKEVLIDASSGAVVAVQNDSEESDEDGEHEDGEHEERAM
jgi:uncharacterized membrane protein YkoI